MEEIRESFQKRLYGYQSVKSKEIIVVGDKATGKSSLIYRCLANDFLQPDSPPVPYELQKQVTIDEEIFLVKLGETPSASEYSHLRSISYEKADAFILCFAADNPESFSNISKIWLPEIKKYKPLIPFVLASTKCDLKSVETVRNLISFEDGKLLAEEINAFHFIECSAKTTEGCLDVLKSAMKANLAL